MPKALTLKEKYLSIKSGIPDDFRWKTTFMALFSREFESAGIHLPVIIGGQALEMYSFGMYASLDIDIKSDRDATFGILRQLGFELRGTHLWESLELDILIDWQGADFEQDEDIRRHVLRLETGEGLVTLLPIEELIVDRLCAAKFWKHAPSGEWARYLYEIAPEHGITLNRDFLARRVAKENIQDFFDRICLNKNRTD
jgi:hypothetical protein